MNSNKFSSFISHFDLFLAFPGEPDEACGELALSWNRPFHFSLPQVVHHAHVQGRVRTSQTEARNPIRSRRNKEDETVAVAREASMAGLLGREVED